MARRFTVNRRPPQGQREGVETEMTDLTAGSNEPILFPRGLATLWPRPVPLAYPAIESVQAYWESLRADSLAPARTLIDPRPLAEVLDSVFIAELVAPTVARLRLVGQRLTELLGLELRGMPLSVLLAHDARGALEDALAQVAHGARVILPLKSSRGLGRPGIEARMLLLPLADHTGRLTKILGVLEYHGVPGRFQRPLSLATQTPIQQVAPQGREVPTPAAPLRATLRPSPSPVAASGAAPQPAPAGRPVLRVITGGRA